MYLSIPWILGTAVVSMPTWDQLGQHTLVLIVFQAKTWAKKWGPKKGPKNKTPPGTHSVCPGAPSFSAPFLTPQVWDVFLGMSELAVSSYTKPETML